MIEVEKKFQPTEEQLKAMLEGAEYLGEVVNHDIYYDYPDYRFFKEDIKLRKRNSRFELKVRILEKADREIENVEEIKSYLNVPDNLETFINNNLIVFVDYKTTRKKYKKEGFSIDIDTLNFGISSCDIELLVEKEEDILQAENKIIDFAKKYNLKFEKLLSKRKEYLKLFKPEVYNQLWNYKSA